MLHLLRKLLHFCFEQSVIQIIQGPQIWVDGLILGLGFILLVSLSVNLVRPHTDMFICIKHARKKHKPPPLLSVVWPPHYVLQRIWTLQYVSLTPCFKLSLAWSAMSDTTATAAAGEIRADTFITADETFLCSLSERRKSPDMKTKRIQEPGHVYKPGLVRPPYLWWAIPSCMWPRHESLTTVYKQRSCKHGHKKSRVALSWPSPHARWEEMCSQ